MELLQLGYGHPDSNGRQNKMWDDVLLAIGAPAILWFIGRTIVSALW